MADEITVISDDKKYKTLVTDIGHAKIANAVLNGEKVNIITAVIGDGGGADYKPAGDMTKIKNEVWRGEIANKAINPKSKNMFDIKVILDGNVGGFTVREVGLLDEKGDLIVIANTPPIPKVVLTDGALVPLVIMLHVVFTNSAAVEFTVNPNLDAATHEDLAYAISVHTESEHPDTSFIQIGHHLGCRPQIMALAYQYGAGMGDGPAGGTNLMEIPTKVEYSGKDSLIIYTTKSAAKPDIDKTLRKVSDTEYIVTYKDSDIDAVYIRLLPTQQPKLRFKNHLSHELATLHHGLGAYPQAIAGILQYGAGIAGAGIGPAGGTDIEQIPIRTVWHDSGSLTLYTEEDIQPDALPVVTRASSLEYIITYVGDSLNSIYIRLLTGQSAPVATPPSSDTDMMVSVAAQAVNAHNNSKYAHPDIRLDGGKF